MNFSANTIAQLSHIGWGMALVWGITLFTRDPSWAVWLSILTASLKEGLFDVFFEDAQTRGNGWVDWAFWMLGITVATVAVWISGAR